MPIDIALWCTWRLIVAMLAYYPGGALADRFPVRHLLAASLVATAAGGGYLATIPGPTGLALLYGFWGLRPS